MTAESQQNDELVTPVEASPLIGKSPKTMANERCDKRHKIPYLKIGSRIYYRMSDLKAFRQSCLVVPTEKESK